MEPMNDIAKKTVNTFFNKNVQYFANLKGRWQDEKEYEDFNDYITAVKKVFAENGMNFKSMTKSFKITFIYLNYTLEMKIGMSQASWTRIA